MSVVVFLGPSLPRQEAERILAADYRPPVRQGDIFRLVKQGKPRAIAVIDGYFQEVPSVWHKEILWALDQGIPVFGAASMGALRAAELDRYGMVGIGKIFEAYKSGTYAPYDDEDFEDDDEVAVIHGPAELSFPPLSDAMVDLRETLAAAAREDVIDTALRDDLVRGLKGRFYRERSFDALPQLLKNLDVEAEIVARFVAWLPDGRVAQKRIDASSLLELLASGVPQIPAEGRSYTFERTTLWAQFVEQAEDPALAIGPGERQVLEELRLDPALLASLHPQAVLRYQQLADLPTPLIDDSGRRAALDRLRHRQGLWSRQALDAWARDCDLDRAGLDRLLTYEATLQSVAEAAGSALDGALLDVLRSEGHYPALAERARDKQRVLKDADLAGSAPSALSSATLLDWYFETRLARRVPADIALYASEIGFAGEQDLLAALQRERQYLDLCEPSSPVPGDGGVAMAKDG